ncbi:hypothetical protein KUCAC02_016085 [Chaenocephalus aceratus]|uniref:Uncharacterized protein n=1 Tax=Chaenocephalus aceratus TaxID=36190 RepID=A0ACB9Y1I1_CHAAC|nr:hypothetical protein KUCAC02_016085 [Chaenocephalus aceratus]
MSELEKIEDIPDESAGKGKGIPNGGNAAKTKEDFDLAAIYVSDAQYNRNIYFDTSPEAVRLYLRYNHWLPQVLLYFFILLDLSLAVFEDPAVIPLPSWATMLVELLCLLVFTIRIVHYAKVIPREKFWKDAKNICIIVIIVLTLVDMIIYGSLKASDYDGVRWSRVLRPLLLVNVTEGRQLSHVSQVSHLSHPSQLSHLSQVSHPSQLSHVSHLSHPSQLSHISHLDTFTDLRRAFRSIRNALPQIFYVFLLFMFSLLIFSLMALKLIGKRGLTTINGSPYFTNYLEIIFDLYVLVTTANSPDIMMPAYNASYFFAIFFILYILINNYIFMSVFLAVVYNNYKYHLKEEVRQLVRAKRHKMVRAFAVLQDQREGREPAVNQANWNQLVRLVQPDAATLTESCWSKVAFVQLADLLNIEVITLKSRPHPLQSLCPNLYQSAPSRLLCKLVQHRAFVIVYDLIILVNAVFIGLDEKNTLIANSEWAFLSLYLLEILLKLYVFEPRAFFSKHSFWNWFDTIIVISALIATIVNSSMTSAGIYTNRQILDIILILRVLRLIRVVDSIKRFRTIINTLIRIGPAILTFGQLILVVYYVFAMVGMELFKNKVKFYGNSSDPAKAYCGNVLLKGTDFAQLNYCKNNFNNVVSSFILLVELTVVNQWHDILPLNASHRNIFVAFVLEAFFVEYSVDKSHLQTSLEKKIEELELAVAQETLEDNLVNAMETIDSDQGTGQSANNKPTLMFKIASKRYRTVDALLQRMFESDLDPEDFAENDDQNGNFANPAFNAA